MDVKDKHGKIIEKGSYVIYTRTRTVGQVLDTKVDEHGSWVLINVAELNNLWYNTVNIEVTDESVIKTFDSEDKKLTKEEILQKANEVYDSEMSDHAVGGG